MRSRAPVLVIGLAVLVSCGVPDATQAPRSVDPSLAAGVDPLADPAIIVSPANASIAGGATVQLNAVFYNKQGKPVSKSYTWTSSANAVATVSASGLVTGISSGNAIISARSGNVTGTATITVTSTPPPPPAGSVLLAAGDIAVCATSFDEATANLLDGQAGTVATLGDLAYNDGTTAEFNNCYEPSWGRHKGRTKPSPGNHEYNTAGAAGYYGYFGAAAGDPTKGYYSYDLGDWHIVVLNSNCSFVACAAGSAQEVWLRADLAATSKPCILAYWHHPRFSSDATHGNNASMAAFWNALYAARADIVLNGHAHTYERFAKQNPSQGAAADGIRAFVVGTGGKSPFYSWSTIQANSQVRNNTTHGVLKLTLGSSAYSWQFLPVAGSTFTDTGSGSCN